ncbi:MAG TPA: hybrid sensor histidine kinase/response regulator, partial [Marinilabiliaceae bacterium]|nr:hybrid sensor histidine kinase/response regulator [Marinilabiliaceae bacterium]
FYHSNNEEAHVFLSLCEDAQGNIWAGTYGGGVFLIDGKSGREIAHYPLQSSKSGYHNSYIYDIFLDSKDRIWLVGVRGNVLCYDFETSNFIDFGNHPVNVIRELPSGDMLLGCSYGVSVLNQETKNVNILLNGYLVQDISVQDSIFWLCTVGDGLVRFDSSSKTTRSFSTDMGLPSAFVNSILVYEDSFWLGTENGLCKFDPLTYKVETFPAIDALSRLSYNRKS